MSFGTVSVDLGPFEALIMEPLISDQIFIIHRIRGYEKN